MTVTSAQLAALDYLATVPDRPHTVWPNLASDGPVPRWEVFEGPVTQTTALLNGGTQASLLLQVDVVVDAETGSANMRDQVEKVLAAFPVGQRFGGAIVLTPPSVGGYRKDGQTYRVSITVPYRLL